MASDPAGGDFKQNFLRVRAADYKLANADGVDVQLAQYGPDRHFRLTFWQFNSSLGESGPEQREEVSIRLGIMQMALFVNAVGEAMDKIPADVLKSLGVERADP